MTFFQRLLTTVFSIPIFVLIRLIHLLAFKTTPDLFLLLNIDYYIIKEALTLLDRTGPVPLEHRVHAHRDSIQLPTPSTTGPSPEWKDRAKMEGMDAKPIAILFPCFHRNVAPGREEQNEKTSNYERMQSPTPGISRRKTTVKSTYCNTL